MTTNHSQQFPARAMWVRSLSEASTKNMYSLLGDAMRLSGSVRLPAVGTSMVPAIRPGDLVTIHPVEPSAVAIGDIVVYVKEQNLVVHRVVRTLAGARDFILITRGDRAKKDDLPVAGTDLLGRVVCIDRRERQVDLRSALHPAQRALRLVLSRSDRATRVFLQAMALWDGIFSKENA